MRVTIGERLGIPRVVTRVQLPTPVTPIEIDAVIGPSGSVVDLSACPSSSLPWGERESLPDDGGPQRVRGEMVWIKKDVAILRIEGRPDLAPHEFAENRRR